MKNTDKKVNGFEQKLYTALIGFGVFALSAVTVIYGVRTQKSFDFVKQKTQLGEQNPVTGPVAKTEANENTVKEKKTEEKGEIQDKIQQNGQEQVRESTAAVMSYNGKDKLTWPVSGNVIIPYSMDTTVYFETLDQYQCNPALYVKAEEGAEVEAVFGGTVTHVAESSRYGNQITLDMGNGYKMIYGQIKDIPYKKGDVVEKGQVLGKIAEPTDYYILEGSHLYMKMTYKDKAVNPTEYMEP